MKKSFLVFQLLLLTSCMSEPRKQENEDLMLSSPTENKEVVEITTVENIVDKTNDVPSQNLNTNIESIMTLRLLESLISMSPEEFKNWVSINGYNSDGTEDYEYFKVMSFRKSKNFISYALNNEGRNESFIVYETADGEEYNNLKNSSITQGYRDSGDEKITRKSGEIVYMNNYINERYKLSLYLTDISQNLGYSITLKKL